MRTPLSSGNRHPVVAGIYNVAVNIPLKQKIWWLHTWVKRASSFLQNMRKYEKKRCIDPFLTDILGSYRDS